MGKKKFYRTIIVDGVKYEYRIGRRNVKIKGLGVWGSGIIGQEYDDDRFLVTPQNIADWIHIGMRKNLFKRNK